LKAMLGKSNINIPSFEEVAATGDGGNLPIGNGQMTVEYIDYSSGTPSRVLATYTSATTPSINVTNTTKYQEIAGWITSITVDLFNTTGGKLVFTDITFYVSPGQVEIFHHINLLDMMVDFWTKSSLKIQNRSLGASGNVEEDAIDNTPLNGYVYYGYGAGMTPSRAGLANWDAFELTADQDLGTINQTEPTYSFDSDDMLLRPQPIRNFSGASKQGKIRFNPGDIKTNNCYYKKLVTIEEFLHQTYSTTTLGGLHTKKGLMGKFTVFALEKTLDTHTGLIEPTDTIKIAVEQTLRMHLNVLERSQRNTLPVTVTHRTF
jgi:hypothetical protein